MDEIKTIVPNPYQYEVLSSTSRVIFAVAGLQGGKTWTGVQWANRKIGEGEDLLFNKKVSRWRGIIAAPSYDQLYSSVISKLFEEYPDLERYHDKKNRMLHSPMGWDVYFRSLEEPKYIRGITADWIWVDEADYMDKGGWTPIYSRTAKTQGQILCTSSISKSSWIYDMYEKNPKEYELIHWRSIDNPEFPKDEWERLKRTMDPTEFNREYGAEFVFGSDKVFSNILQYGVLEKNELPAGIKPMIGFLGIDYGHFDPTAMGAILYCTDLNWYIVDEEYSTRLDMDQINNRGEAIVSRNPSLRYAIVDPRGGIPKYSMKIGIPIIDGESDIDSGILLVKNLIYQKRLFVFPQCTNHIREFGSYSYTPNGMPDTKRNNHCMDEVRYVIKTASKFANGYAPEIEEEEIPLFWQQKKDDGIYLGEGKIADKQKWQEFDADLSEEWFY